MPGRATRARIIAAARLRESRNGKAHARGLERNDRASLRDTATTRAQTPSTRNALRRTTATQADRTARPTTVLRGVLGRDPDEQRLMALTLAAKDVAAGPDVPIQRHTPRTLFECRSCPSCPGRDDVMSTTSDTASESAVIAPTMRRLRRGPVAVGRDGPEQIPEDAVGVPCTSLANVRDLRERHGEHDALAGSDSARASWDILQDIFGQLRTILDNSGQLSPTAHCDSRARAPSRFDGGPAVGPRPR